MTKGTGGFASTVSEDGSTGGAGISHQIDETPYLDLPAHPMARIVLGYGLCGAFFMPLLAPFAWYYGSRTRAEIAANPGTYRSSTQITVGLWLGVFGTVLLGITLPFAILMLAVVIMSV